MKIYNSSKATFQTEFGPIKPGVNIISTNGLISNAIKGLDKILKMYKQFLSTENEQEKNANILVAPPIPVQVNLEEAIEAAKKADEASSKADDRTFLFAKAKELGLNPAFNIKTDKLRSLVAEKSAEASSVPQE